MKTLNDHIEESLIKSYDTNKLISIIYKKYPDIQYNFNKSKSKEFLFVIYFNKKSDYDVIKSAIKYHNKFQIPASLSVRETLHSRIIRDADKLDIIYAMSTDKLISITDDDSEISEEVKEEFFSHNEIRKEITKSKNDKIVLMLALIFDLNYDYSKHRVLDEEYLERILENLNNKKMFKPFIDEGIKYLKGELN